MARLEFWIVEYEGQRYRWQGFPLVAGLTFLYDYGRAEIHPKDMSLPRFHIFWSHETGQPVSEMEVF